MAGVAGTAGMAAAPDEGGPGGAGGVAASAGTPWMGASAGSSTSAVSGGSGAEAVRDSLHAFSDASHVARSDAHSLESDFSAGVGASSSDDASAVITVFVAGSVVPAGSAMATVSD